MHPILQYTIALDPFNNTYYTFSLEMSCIRIEMILLENSSSTKPCKNLTTITIDYLLNTLEDAFVDEYGRTRIRQTN
jgi:hypothetical protein